MSTVVRDAVFGLDTLFSAQNTMGGARNLAPSHTQHAADVCIVDIVQCRWAAASSTVAQRYIPNVTTLR